MNIRTAKDEITSVESWFALAPPKGKMRQWVDGRSAKELAKVWFETEVARAPKQLADLLESHPDFGRVTWEWGEPEARIPFDKIKGEPRNTDLAIRAHDDKGTIAISIEAKANEPFGPMLGDALADAIDRQISNPRSRAPERIEQLIQALLPPANTALPSLKSLRYQLLTATAGALAWAAKCKSSRALLVVHEFRSTKTNPSMQAANHADLDRFIRRLAGSNIQKNIEPSTLLGPINVKGVPLFTQPAHLYFGLIVTHCTL